MTDEETSSDDVVSVRRSGGVTGTVRTGSVDLNSDPRAPEIRQLLDRADLTAIQSGPPQPDRFVYALSYREHHVQLGEQDLDADLGQLIRMVLDSGVSGPAADR